MSRKLFKEKSSDEVIEKRARLQHRAQQLLG